MRVRDPDWVTLALYKVEQIRQTLELDKAPPEVMLARANVIIGNQSIGGWIQQADTLFVQLFGQTQRVVHRR